MRDRLAEAIKVILWLALIAFLYGWLLNSQAHAETTTQPQPELSVLATTLVGQPTFVVCVPTDPNGEAAGWVNLPEPIIYLDGHLCGALTNTLKHSPRTMRWARTFDGGQTVGYAFLAYLHEITHLIEYHSNDPTSAYDEGLTECTAWRNTWPMLRVLGLDWKARRSVYQGAYNYHFGKPTAGINAAYRSVC